MSAAETAVCMGMDAMRICIGMKPKNFTAKQVIRWMRSLTKARDGDFDNGSKT